MQIVPLALQYKADFDRSKQANLISSVLTGCVTRFMAIGSVPAELQGVYEQQYRQLTSECVATTTFAHYV
eukprot:scaffold16170_cov45-Cyclotella_meneghiniana.AAC.2